MKFAVIIILVVLMSVGAFLCAQPGVQSAPQAPLEHADQAADVFWVLLLSTFSLIARFGKKNRSRYHFLSVAVLLLVLAAFHSHPLWGSRKPLPEIATVRHELAPPVIPACEKQRVVHNQPAFSLLKLLKQ